MTNEYKTLSELNVQPGDVVVNNLHGARPVEVDRIEGGDFWSKSMRMSRAPVWRIVFRASDTPKKWGDGGMKLEEGKYYRTADGKKVGPVRIADTHIPDKWALWSFEGKIYEVVGLPREDAFDTEIIAEEVDHYHVFNRSEFRPKLWRDMTPKEREMSAVMECIEYVDEVFDSEMAQRAREQLEIGPKRETVKLYGSVTDEVWGRGGPTEYDTHRITFEMIDGVPIWASIKMEEL